MHIIPVLDIKAGEVVRAWRGRRDQYRPLHCALCAGSEPEDVLGSLLDLYPFRIVYVADIDAITGHGDNLARVSQLAARHREVDFWLDAGWREPAQAEAALGQNLTAVIGSETLNPAATAPLSDRFVLSLDYDRDGFRGPAALQRCDNLWPRRVIMMELDRVGAGAGPDRTRLKAMTRRYPGHEWYAAGGVRDDGDLRALSGDGAAGVLVASILYDGHLTENAIADLEGRTYSC